MKSLMFRFITQGLPSSAAVVALLGLVGVGGPARADTLCASAAAQGGYGGDTFTPVAGPLDATCGTNSAVQMSIPNQTSGYAKLTWDPTVAGYPAGLTLGNLVAIDAAVADQQGGQPFYMLAFTDNNDPFLNTTNGDQILMIEFQNTNVFGTSMAVDPNQTLFNLYDNTTSQYLEAGQADANTLAYWFSQDPLLAGDALQQVRIGIGMAGGGSAPVALTVDSLDITGGSSASVPEPTSLLLLLTVVGATGLGLHRQVRNRRS